MKAEVPAYRKRAYGIFKAALNRGAIERPRSCSRCGDSPSPNAAGNSQIHGHHHKGYDYPLDVEWLCVKCHRAVTPKPSSYNPTPQPGSLNGRAKLNESQVSEIVKMISEGVGGSKISRIYGVSPNLIWQIKVGRLWTTIERPKSGEEKHD